MNGSKYAGNFMNNKNLTLALLCLLGGSLAVAEDNTVRPNVIVMIADDLGYGDVSCLGNGAVKTPNIDRIARSGVKFTSGYVPVPLCGPSRAGFFTGRYPQRFGFSDNVGGIPTDLPLLPGVLRNAGYHTGLIGKWHSTGPMPHERGCFDETLCSPKSSPFIDYHQPTLARNGKVEEFKEYSTDLFADETVKFIESNRAKPFSLTVAFNAPHILKSVGKANSARKAYDKALAAGKILDISKAPSARPNEASKYAKQFPGDSARADTVATIVALDEAVGRILDKLKQTGLDKNTILFLFADNGGHPENRSENLPLRDYKWTVHEGGIRVPFLAAYPGVFPAGLTFAQPVSTLDIFPTVAALAGVPPPAGTEGVNLTPFLKGEKTTAPHDALYFKVGGKGAVRQEEWKLVMEPHSAPLLFDLVNDKEEKNDLASAQPERVKDLTAKWQAWNAQMPGEQKGRASGKKKSGGKASNADEETSSE
jgi:arylsulfatase A-like enzyme